MNVVILLGIVITLGLGFYFLWKSKGKFAWGFLLLSVVLMATLVSGGSSLVSLDQSQEIYISYLGVNSVDIKPMIETRLIPYDGVPSEIEESVYALVVADTLGNINRYVLFQDDQSRLVIQMNDQYWLLDPSVLVTMEKLYVAQNVVTYDGPLPNVEVMDIQYGQIPLIYDKLDRVNTYYEMDNHGKHIKVFFANDDEYQVVNYFTNDESPLSLKVPSWAETVYLSFPGYQTVRATTMVDGYETKVIDIPNRFSVLPVTGGGRERHVVAISVDQLGSEILAKTYSVFLDEPIDDETIVYRSYTFTIIVE